MSTQHQGPPISGEGRGLYQRPPGLYTYRQAETSITGRPSRYSKRTNHSPRTPPPFTAHSSPPSSDLTRKARREGDVVRPALTHSAQGNHHPNGDGTDHAAGDMIGRELLSLFGVICSAGYQRQQREEKVRRERKGRAITDGSSLSIQEW
jgi:hypothetical protein